MTNVFQRLRPCSNPEINTIIQFKVSSFSFFSGHASNSMAVATFMYCVMHYYKFGYLLFLWPLVFAYSRIYLGLHYPIDILSGFYLGYFGYLVFKYIKQSKKSISHFSF
jgi:undecaprenyl-diphosphatase